MASRRWIFNFEPLEGRRLLSHAATPLPADVCVPASLKKTVSVVGTIPGIWAAPKNVFGSGNLPALGHVQFGTRIPFSGGIGVEHATLILTTGVGTLTFAVTSRGGHTLLNLTVQSGTNAYAGWSGSGTMTYKLTEFGYHREFTDLNTFKLRLKT